MGDLFLNYFFISNMLGKSIETMISALKNLKGNIGSSQLTTIIAAGISAISIFAK